MSTFYEVCEWSHVQQRPHRNADRLFPSRFPRRQMAVPTNFAENVVCQRSDGVGGKCKKQRRRKLRKFDGNCGASCWKPCRANSVIWTPERLQLCGSCCVRGGEKFPRSPWELVSSRGWSARNHFDLVAQKSVQFIVEMKRISCLFPADVDQRRILNEDQVPGRNWKMLDVPAKF